MSDPDEHAGRAAAIRFTLVASAVVLALLADHFIRTDDIRWAAAPLVIAVACLAFADTRRASKATDDQPEPQESATLTFGRFSADPNFRFSVDLNERTFGTLAAVCAMVLMGVSLRNFGHDERESLTLAWHSFGAAVALALVAIPAIDYRWTALILRTQGLGRTDDQAPLCGSDTSSDCDSHTRCGPTTLQPRRPACRTLVRRGRQPLPGSQLRPATQARFRSTPLPQTFPRYS